MARDGAVNIDGLGNGRGSGSSSRGEASVKEGPGQRERAYDPPPRRPKSQRENAFDLGTWLMQGVLGISEELRHNDLGLPEEFWVHAYAARKETLLALRALVDAAIAKCDEEEAPPQKKRPQRGRVPID